MFQCMSSRTQIYWKEKGIKAFGRRNATQW